MENAATVTKVLKIGRREVKVLSNVPVVRLDRLPLTGLEDSIRVVDHVDPSSAESPRQTRFKGQKRVTVKFPVGQKRSLDSADAVEKVSLTRTADGELKLVTHIRPTVKKERVETSDADETNAAGPSSSPVETCTTPAKKTLKHLKVKLREGSTGQQSDSESTKKKQKQEAANGTTQTEKRRKLATVKLAPKEEIKQDDDGDDDDEVDDSNLTEKVISQ